MGLTPGMPLAFPYLAVNQGVIDALTPTLGADPLGIIPFLQGFVPTGSTGTLFGWNIFEGPEVPLGVEDNEPIGLQEFQTFEIGYTGNFSNRFKVNLDIYDNPIFEYPSVLCTGDEKNLQALEG